MSHIPSSERPWTQDDAAAAIYDPVQPALVVRNVSVADPVVCLEALRWSSGLRGPAVGGEAMAGIDLSVFVTQALTVGARAIAMAGVSRTHSTWNSCSGCFSPSHVLLSAEAAEATKAVALTAGAGHGKASRDVRKTLIESGDLARKTFTETVESARKDLRDEITRLVGGEDSELPAPRCSHCWRRSDATLMIVWRGRQPSYLTRRQGALSTDEPTSPMAKNRNSWNNNNGT